MNYCQQTKWIQNAKNLRYFIMGHCCLYFHDIDQSIDLFLKASYNLAKDQLLRKFIKLDEKISRSNELHARAEDENAVRTEISSNRRSILINRKSSRRFTMDKSLNESSEMMNDSINNGSSVLPQSNQNFNNLANENLLLLEYYTQVIHYLDLNGNLLAAIELIQSALLKCQFDSNSKSKLYCILFKTYMELEYFDKAHMALMSNLDTEWKKTCLKHFITELCNQNKTEMLINFDYADMLLDVLYIIYNRAQTTDLYNNPYYRVLYAMYIKSNDYRNAAFCMYEYATRLRKETSGIMSLTKQEKCYLACLNVLKLVDKKFSWFHVIQQSVDAVSDNSVHIPAKKIAKLHEFQMFNSTNQSSLVLQESNVNKKLNYQIIDLDEINKNYLLVHYMIKISSLVQNQSTICKFFSNY